MIVVAFVHVIGEIGADVNDLKQLFVVFCEASLHFFSLFFSFNYLNF